VLHLLKVDSNQRNQVEIGTVWRMFMVWQAQSKGCSGLIVVNHQINTEYRDEGDHLMPFFIREAIKCIKVLMYLRDS